MTIDELIAFHWGTCTVQHGESPEHYAIRRQLEARFKDAILCVRIGEQGVVKITHPDGVVEFLRWEGVV